MSDALTQLLKISAARQRRSRSSAFTLLELVLAMTMVAMLSLSLYAAMSTAFKAKTAAERAILPGRAVSIAADLIGKDLESVVAPSPVTLQVAQDPTITTLFVAGSFTGLQESGSGGEADWIEFTSVGNDGVPDGVPLSAGMRRIDIGVRSDIDPPSLVRRIQRNVLAVQELEPDEEIICRNVKSFSVRYFDGTDWYESWDSTIYLDANGAPALPMIVQIELVLNMPDWQQPGQEANTYSITRMIPITIAKPVDPDVSTTASAGRIPGT